MPHADGLSSAQVSALTGLINRWRDVGGGPIVIQAPGHGGGEAYRAAINVQAELGALGVPDDQIRLVGYKDDDRAGGPVVVGFERFEAQGPACGRDWTSFTTNITNSPNSNFGCASTANMAALVANPADLVRPRTMDPADAGRRETVIGKYRQGVVTSAAKDEQAVSSISDAVH